MREFEPARPRRATPIFRVHGIVRPSLNTNQTPPGHQGLGAFLQRVRDLPFVSSSDSRNGMLMPGRDGPHASGLAVERIVYLAGTATRYTEYLMHPRLVQDVGHPLGGSGHVRNVGGSY